MAYSDHETKLSLDRWAELMGVDPIAFHGATVSCSTSVFPPNCNSYWRQFPWQSAANISREALAQAVSSAEKAVEKFLGTSISPKWKRETISLTTKEANTLKRFGTVELTLSTDQILSTGRNERQLIHGTSYSEFDALASDPRRIDSDGTIINGIAQNSALSVSYSDNDSDGFDETATVTVPNVTAGDECDYEIWIPGKRGRGGYRIYPKASSFDFASGDLVLEFWAWQMISPSVSNSIARYDSSLAQKIAPIDLCDVNNLLTEVEVWRSIVSPDYSSAVISMRQAPCNCTAGCPKCTVVDYPGCILVRDSANGYARVSRADLVQDDQTLQWSYDCCGNGIAPWHCGNPIESDIPFQITVYYKSGCEESDGVCNDMCYAEEVAILAAARLNKEICECGCDVQRLSELRRDYSMVTPTFTPRVTLEDLRNPFGTREGEIMVYRRLKHLLPGLEFGGVIK